MTLFSRAEREAVIERIVAQLPKADQKSFRKQLRKLTDAELLIVKVEQN